MDPLAPAPDTPDELFRQMYQDLRRLASSRLRRSENITLLDTTALVHETYMRFQRQSDLGGASPLGRPEGEHPPGGRAQSALGAGFTQGQFLAYAARVMRFVVIDFVRQRHAERRGGDQLHVTLNTDIAESISVKDDDVVRIHDAIEELAQVDDRLARIVEMRCFAGLDEVSIAQALGITDRTVRRDWQKARLLLKAVLQ